MYRYCCKNIKEDIIIDGNANKYPWYDMESIQLVDNITGNIPIQSTSVKLTWSTKFLYIMFHCADIYFNASYRGYNKKIYNEDVVEVFIDCDNDFKTYIEIETNPLNATLHYFIINNLSKKLEEIVQYAKVKKSIQVKVIRDNIENTWDAEIAIPFNEFITAPNLPPKVGDKWLMNLYRIDRVPDREVEYTAWSPTGIINYHIPEKFGELIFVT